MSRASGALAAGVIDRQATTSLDVGIDLTGRHYALGVGARLRWLMSDGFRSADWDERSEWAGVVRYLSYARAHESVVVALAVGELGGVQLGHGAVIDGYASGLDIDHRHLGAQVRIDGRRFGGEALLDDLVAPRIVGARGYYLRGSDTRRFAFGGSLVADIAAPTSAVEAGAQVLPMVSLDSQAELVSADDRFAGALHCELVAIATMAAGIHAGLSARARAWGAWFALRAELRAGTDHYLPGYIGPLYEIDRRARPMPMPDGPMPVASQLDRIRLGGLSGLGGLVEMRVQIPEYGEVSAYYARRVGLADLLTARLSAPYLRDVQLAAWLATEVSDLAQNWILASEVRVRITDRFFAGAELARMYRQSEGMPAPVWLATASFGATLGW